MTLGRAIKIIREAKGLRLNHVARNSGLSLPYLSLIESGEREPSLSALKSIAKVLKVPMDALLAIVQPGEGSLVSSDERVAKLSNTLHTLSDIEKRLRTHLNALEQE